MRHVRVNACARANNRAENGAIRSKREVLSRLVSLHGAPLFMRSDNGPEFVGQTILA